MKGFAAVLALAPLLPGGAQAAERLLVLHKGAGSVGFYDPVSGQKLATAAVGHRPHEMAFSADRRLLYVTNYGVGSYTDEAEGGRTISIVDVRRGQAAGEIDLGEARRPHGIALGRSGRLYVTVDHPAALLIVDPARRVVERRHALDQSLPHMVAVLPDETKAYTANSGSGTVSAIALGGGAVKQIRIGGVPMGFASSRDGHRLYATNRNGDAVIVIDTARDEVVGRIDLPGQPVRLLPADGGRLLLASLMEAGAVAVVDAVNLALVARLPAGKGAEGLAVDAAGRFGYVSAQGEDKVVKFTMGDWKPVLEIKTEAMPDPVLVVEED